MLVLKGSWAHEADLVHQVNRVFPGMMDPLALKVYQVQLGDRERLE
ncbi:hypothetical protein NP493_256g02006 [Ridgeia piscesae]|uniref:Uncharacterized protein n=1 Tax=Ridgeia piscesae TaxID=27915 RepID=A0AAD9UCU1_RIDPI|nr:hypothetical protein NP493_256g02006 [Ridgeia piscesae]